MALVSSSKVTFFLPFNFIPEPSPLMVELLSTSSDPNTSAPRVPTGEPGPAATLTVSLAQNRKTIPAEGLAACVVAPVSDDASGR